MNCGNCGHPMPGHAKFCDVCGKPVEAVNSTGQKVPNKLKVLIIDDDPMYLEAYSFKFAKEGFDIVLARSGREGLRAARRDHPSVILLDIVMQDMSGLVVLEKLKEDPRTKNIPVVLVTILAEKADIEKGLALGAEYYITKEKMTSDEVVAKVKGAAVGSASAKN